MFKKTINMITVAAFLFYTFAGSGCTRKTVIVPIDEIKRDTSGQVLNARKAVKGQIRGVYTAKGAYFFDEHYARIDSATNAVVGSTVNQERLSLPLTTVDSLSVARTSVNKTTLSIIAVCTVLAVVLALAVSPVDLDDAGWSLP
ncbi:MAG: hypothetical protein JSV52_06645 [Candidatus Zixiibacteriota bacterium]|nr:MAG: hypothetical protein JSV52_06645 [candidate division Zixibacteria bacterium]